MREKTPGLILMVFSVFDSAVGAYLQPFIMRSRGEALRSFRTAVNDQSHQFNKYADDYTLFYIGDFDEESGQLSPVGPVSMGSAVEYLEKGEYQASVFNGETDIERVIQEAREHG